MRPVGQIHRISSENKKEELGLRRTGIMGIKEMADYLNMKEQTVYRLVQQKKIPAIKIGGQWKAKRDHIDKLFDEMLQEKIKELRTS